MGFLVYLHLSPVMFIVTATMFVPLGLEVKETSLFFTAALTPLFLLLPKKQVCFKSHFSHLHHPLTHYCSMRFPHIFLFLPYIFSEIYLPDHYQSIPHCSCIYFCGFKIYVVLPSNTSATEFHEFLFCNVLYTSTTTEAHGHTLVLVRSKSCNFFFVSIVWFPFGDHKFLSFCLISSTTLTPKYLEHTEISSLSILLLFHHPSSSLYFLSPFSLA